MPNKKNMKDKKDKKEEGTRGICRHALEGRKDGYLGIKVADSCPRKVRVHGIALVPYTRCEGCPNWEPL